MLHKKTRKIPNDFLCFLRFLPLTRAAINLEPKIGCLKKISLYNLKRKQLFLFARPASDRIFAYLSSRPFALAMSYSQLPSWNRQGKCFFRVHIS